MGNLSSLFAISLTMQHGAMLVCKNILRLVLKRHSYPVIMCVYNGMLYATLLCTEHRLVHARLRNHRPKYIFQSFSSPIVAPREHALTACYFNQHTISRMYCRQYKPKLPPFITRTFIQIFSISPCCSYYYYYCYY